MRLTALFTLYIVVLLSVHKIFCITEIPAGSQEYRNLLFPDTQLNTAIVATPAAKKQFPIVVEYAIPQQSLFQLYAFKQDETTEGTKHITGIDPETYKRFIYGGTCGRHAPKNAACCLVALNDYYALAHNSGRALANKEQLINQFIAYGQSITFLTELSLKILQALDEKIACYRIPFKTPPPGLTTTMESIRLAGEINTIAGIQQLAPGSITYCDIADIASATSTSSMDSLEKPLIEEIARFRQNDTYHHGFTVGMNMHNLHDTSTSNHGIAVVVYKVSKKPYFIVIDSGTSITNTITKKVVFGNFANFVNIQVISSANLLESAPIQVFIALLTTTPLPPEYTTQPKKPAVPEKQPFRFLSLLSDDVPYIPILRDESNPKQISYQLLIEEYYRTRGSDPEEALMLLQTIDHLQAKDAQHGRSYVPIFINNMGLTPEIFAQKRKAPDV